MAFVDCKFHGIEETLFCCRHVRVGPDRRLMREPEDYIFDWTLTGFLVCSSCVEAAERFVVARTDEEIQASAFAYILQCLGCLDEALQKTKYGSFAGLKRALGTPER